MGVMVSELNKGGYKSINLSQIGKHRKGIRTYVRCTISEGVRLAMHCVV